MTIFIKKNEISSDKNLILNNILEYVNHKIAANTEILSEDVRAKVVLSGTKKAQPQKNKRTFLSACGC